MKNLIIIKTGATFPEIASRCGDFDDWVRQGLGLSQAPVVTIDAQNGASLPDASDCAGVVITGSHAMVTERLAWSMAIERWIPALLAARVPLLGICYGHQLLAQATGGEVDYHPDGSEAGTVDISLLPSAADDALFSGLPQAMPVHAVHAQTVVRLPHGAVHLARNAFESHHAFRLGECAWGVQFHPEYDEEIISAYLQAETDNLTRQARGVRRLLAQVRATPDAALLLRRFGQLVLQRQSK